MAKSRSGLTSGAGAGVTPSQPANPPNSVRDTKNVDELRRYMKDKYDINVDKSVDTLDFGLAKTAAAGIEDVIKEFPLAAGLFHEISGNPASRSGELACANMNGRINLNQKRYDGSTNLAQTYADSTANGFHPAGTTADHISVHEAGHILEVAMIYNRIKDGEFTSRYDRIMAWNKCKYAKELISEAAKLAKKMPDGKGKKIGELIRDVSVYSTYTRSEAMAECVADYTANRQNAKPLSRAVWALLKRELCSHSERSQFRSFL